MSGLLLGIDVGTASSKGVLVEPDGTIVQRARVEHAMDVPRPGWAEQDADRVWWHDVVHLCTTLLRESGRTGDDVAAVAVSAIGPCLLPLDETDRPLRPGILYGVDTRASAEIELLESRVGADAIFEFSGMALTSQAVGPKLLWLQRHEPDVWRRTRRVTSASSYAVLRLTGEHVIDRHTAAHFMPLMDVRTLEWSERFAAEVAPLDMLPRLAWSDEQAGTVSPLAAAETGLRAGTPVAVGTVDALAEAVSVGAVDVGDLMVMYGSTTFFILTLDAPVPDERTWTVGGAFAGQYALAAGMATTGSLTRWFKDELARDLDGPDAYAQLFDGAARVAAGSEGLLVLPYFSGERTPINDPRARGVIAGLSLAHGRDALFRATLEGVAFGVRHNVETFAAMGAPVERVVAVGGGTRGGLWLQIVSDVTGIEQVVPAETIGASYGDAFLAGRAAGLLERDDLRSWVRPGRVVQPDTALKTATYDARYEAYTSLYTASREVVHALATAADAST